MTHELRICVQGDTSCTSSPNNQHLLSKNHTYLGTFERHRPALFNVNGGHPLFVFLILRSACGGILLAGNVQSGRLGRSRLMEDKDPTVVLLCEYA